MVDVQVGGGGLVVAHAADAGAGRAVPVLAEDGLDVVLFGVGQLEAAAREELDAVVGHRVVRGGDHRTHFDVEHGSQVGDARGRDDARVDHVEAAGRHAGRQGRRQKIAGDAGIAADKRAAAPLGLIVLRAGIPQHAHGGVAQIERQLRGQITVGQSTDTIGSEHTWHVPTSSLFPAVITVHHRTRTRPRPPPTGRMSTAPATSTPPRAGIQPFPPRTTTVCRQPRKT